MRFWDCNGGAGGVTVVDAGFIKLVGTLTSVASINDSEKDPIIWPVTVSAGLPEGWPIFEMGFPVNLSDPEIVPMALLAVEELPGLNLILNSAADIEYLFPSRAKEDLALDCNDLKMRVDP